MSTLVNLGPCELCQKFLRSLTTELFSRESDEGLTLETSALKLFPVANLRYQLSL